MAYLEAKLVLVRLLQNFDLALNPNTIFEPARNVTTTLGKPLYVDVLKRYAFILSLPLCLLFFHYRHFIIMQCLFSVFLSLPVISSPPP